MTSTIHEPHAAGPAVMATGDYLDVPVRDFMRAGVVSIVEDASLRQAYRAMVDHRVHAVLVVGRREGRPLGWVTARGLLSRLDDPDRLVSVRDAVTERPETIEPSASAREALVALSQPGVGRLLVAHRSDHYPEGVVTDLDLLRLAHA
jgi:CBS domain-containing protein